MTGSDVRLTAASCSGVVQLANRNGRKVGLRVNSLNLNHIFGSKRNFIKGRTVLKLGEKSH